MTASSHVPAPCSPAATASYAPVPAVIAQSSIPQALGSLRATSGPSCLDASVVSVRAPSTASSYFPPPAGFTATASYAPPTAVLAPSVMTSSLPQTFGSLRATLGQTPQTMGGSMKTLSAQTASYIPGASSVAHPQTLVGSMKTFPGQTTSYIPGSSSVAPPQNLGGSLRTLPSQTAATLSRAPSYVPGASALAPCAVTAACEALPARIQSFGSLRAFPGQSVAVTPAPSYTPAPSVVSGPSGASALSTAVQVHTLLDSLSRSNSMHRANSMQRTESEARSVLTGSMTAGLNQVGKSPSFTATRSESLSGMRHVSAPPVRLHSFQGTPSQSSRAAFFGLATTSPQTATPSRSNQLSTPRRVETPMRQVSSLSHPAAGGMQTIVHIDQAHQPSIADRPGVPAPFIADKSGVRSEMLGDRARGVYSRIKELEAELARLQNFTFLPEMR